MAKKNQGEIVVFRMPDGTEVSNDPRWVAEEQREAMQAALEATPNRGRMGPTEEEQNAAMGGGMGAPQSTQEGVGERATLDDPDDALGAKLTGQVLQTQDAEVAEERGVSPSKPRRQPPEPVDSNERVAEARERAQKRREAAQEARRKLAEAGEEPGDPDSPYEDWTSKQLKAEVAARRADGREVDTSGVKNKKDLAARLRAADEAESHTQ